MLLWGKARYSLPKRPCPGRRRGGQKPPKRGDYLQSPSPRSLWYELSADDQSMSLKQVNPTTNTDNEGKLNYQWRRLKSNKVRLSDTESRENNTSETTSEPDEENQKILTKLNHHEGHKGPQDAWASKGFTPKICCSIRSVIWSYLTYRILQEFHNGIFYSMKELKLSKTVCHKMYPLEHILLEPLMSYIIFFF